MNFKLINKLKDKNITGVTRVGGYYRWDYKFPFRHFVKEEIYFFTNCSIYKLEK